MDLGSEQGFQMGCHDSMMKNNYYSMWKPRISKSKKVPGIVSGRSEF